MTADTAHTEMSTALLTPTGRSIRADRQPDNR